MRNIIWFLHAFKEMFTKKGYSIILSKANYSPWLIDEEFKKIWNKISSHTLVDQFRCYELWSLVAQTKHIPGAIFEIGVWRGGTGAIIARCAQLNGINYNIYLCDTFTGVVKATEHDVAYKGGEHSDTAYESVQNLMTSLSLTNVKLLKGIFPDEVANQVTNEKVRFCHIDVDVYQSAKDIFEWAWPKMDVGGIVVFDDYGFSSCNGVTELVNQYKTRDDLCFIHNLNGHAILIKTK